MLLILTALLCRMAAVAVCLIKTPLTRKERLFCMIAYCPKATVQAAIGAVPLSLGLACGELVLSAAVMAILITAPLGALGIDLTYRRWLKRKQSHCDAGVQRLNRKSRTNRECSSFSCCVFYDLPPAVFDDIEVAAMILSADP